MKAVILAAGASTRFYPLSEDRPKCLVPLLGKPILTRTIFALENLDIFNEIILVVSDRELFKKYWHQENFKTKITIIIQEKPLGMADALLKAKNLLDEDFLLLHAHHFDISDFISLMLKKKNEAEAVLLAEEKENFKDFGVLKIENDRVLGLVEKPKEEIGKLCVKGIYLLSKEFVPFLEKFKTSHYLFEEALDKWVKEKVVKFVKADKPLISLKYPWDLLKLKDYLLEKLPHQISRGAKIGKGVILVGKMIIEEGATIFENAVIKGPVYIGKNVLVGNNALIRDGTILEENARIGAFSEVKNSIFLPGASLGSGFVASSIVGENCRLAHGFTTANRRFDRENIKVNVKGEKIDTGMNDFGAILGEGVYTGINVGIMPGKIIGKKAIIGPGTFVFEDIPPTVKYRTKFKNIIKKI